MLGGGTAYASTSVPDRVYVIVTAGFDDTEGATDTVNNFAQYNVNKQVNEVKQGVTRRIACEVAPVESNCKTLGVNANREPVPLLSVTET